jgi:antitoxin MazE
MGPFWLYFGYPRRYVSMVTKVQKWGNSQGLRLSKQLLDEAHIAVGDDVDVKTSDGVIIIAPVRRVRGKHNLEDLVARIPRDYKAKEVDWGKSVGGETW